MVRTLLLSLVFMAMVMAADEPGPFDGESFTPSATGVMIIKFAPDAQAENLGLKVGDIITSYAGKPLTAQADLIAAVKETTVDAAVVIRRGDQTVTVTAKPGKLGVYMEAVEGGKTQSLPPATPVVFSTERLEKMPLDTWYAFFIDGKKVGAEHAHLQRTGNQLTITVEVMFDGGEKWGLNHMVETGVLDVSTPVPRVITQQHEGPLWGFRSSGRWKDAKTWELTIDAKNEDGTPSHEVLTSTPTGTLINDYSASYLACLMPAKPGACFHTRTVMLSSAQPTAWAALLVIGEEDIVVGDQTVHALRIEQHTLRARGWIAWVKDGEVVKHDYCGAGKEGSTVALRTTKDLALAGLDAKLVPRTAK